MMLPWGVGKSKGPLKEVATLRKFLHKNQDQRFTDKAVSRLFDTIQLYTTSTNGSCITGSSNTINVGLEREHKEGLLEDALKLPHTVFSTKQKKSMIKWLEIIRGTDSHNNNNHVHGETLSPVTRTLSVIDIDEGEIHCSLMDDETGDEFDSVPLPSGTLGDTIKKAFQNSDNAVSIEAKMEGTTVLQIVRLMN